MNSYSEEQLLSMLFLTRTEKLLSKIARDYSMNEDEIKNKYLNMDVDIQKQEKKTEDKEKEEQQNTNIPEVKKKGRGRPKGSTKKKTDLEKFKLEETAIEKFIINFLKGNKKNIKMEKIQKSMEKSLSVTSDNYQIDTFKEIYNKIIQENQQEQKENNEEEEVVSCVEMEFEGNVYLLDKSSMKVYERQSPNDYVGKLEGDVINFDAIDSDMEED